MRTINLEWVTYTPKPGEFGAPEARIYQVMPDGSKERVTLEIQYVEG